MIVLTSFPWCSSSLEICALGKLLSSRTLTDFRFRSFFFLIKKKRNTKTRGRRYLLETGMLKKATFMSLKGLSSATKEGFCSITNRLQAFFRYGSNLSIQGRRQSCNGIITEAVGDAVGRKLKMKSKAKPQVFVGDCNVKKIIGAHEVSEINEHGVRFATHHRFYLCLVVRVTRVPIDAKAEKKCNGWWGTGDRKVEVHEKYSTNLLRKSKKMFSTRTAFSSTK